MAGSLQVFVLEMVQPPVVAQEHRKDTGGDEDRLDVDSAAHAPQVVVDMVEGLEVVHSSLRLLGEGAGHKRRIAGMSWGVRRDNTSDSAEQRRWCLLQLVQTRILGQIGRSCYIGLQGIQIQSIVSDI
jgi:hypothetical protein